MGIGKDYLWGAPAGGQHVHGAAGHLFGRPRVLRALPGSQPAAGDPREHRRRRGLHRCRLCAVLWPGWEVLVRGTGMHARSAVLLSSCMSISGEAMHANSH